jgi:hypothetical protein
MTLTLLAGALAFLLLGLFLRSAASGYGWPNRLVQYVYYAFGSLETYQKTSGGRDGIADMIDHQDRSFVESLIRRVVPSQDGWFAARFPTDKGTYHDYAEKYDALLTPYRALDGVRLLEVGVKKGGSLVLWREFFPHSAFIVGIDVHPGVPRFSRDVHLKVLIMDSRDRKVVGQALRGVDFDIIIDDGLHHPDAQRTTYSVLRPHLKATGVYIIEDAYEFSPDDYEDFGDEATVVPDKSGQSLVVLRPRESLAPHLTV